MVVSISAPGHAVDLYSEIANLVEVKETEVPIAVEVITHCCRPFLQVFLISRSSRGLRLVNQPKACSYLASPEHGLVTREMQTKASRPSMRIRFSRRTP